MCPLEAVRDGEGNHVCWPHSVRALMTAPPSVHHTHAPLPLPPHLLCRLGLQTSYSPMKMDASADKIWEGIKNRYWHLPVYMVPTCVKAETDEQGDNGEEPQ